MATSLDKLILSFDVFCREKPKSEGLVPPRPPDFAGMMRPGHHQSTPFGLSAVAPQESSSHEDMQNFASPEAKFCRQETLGELERRPPIRRNVNFPGNTPGRRPALQIPRVFVLKFRHVKISD